MYKLENKDREKLHFTLLELLIVIAIIVILAGLLLPALNKAKEYSKRICCVNTLGQVGKAFCMYVQDNNDYLPPYRDYGLPERFWIYENPSTGFVAEYLGANRSNTSIGAIKTSSGIIYKSNFLCPSLAVIPPVYGYGYNQYIYAYSSRKITRFNKPSVSCLLSEGRNAAIVSHYTGDYPIEFRHSSGANIVFTDFHTEWRKSQEVNSKASSSDFWRPE